MGVCACVAAELKETREEKKRARIKRAERAYMIGLNKNRPAAVLDQARLLIGMESVYQICARE